MGKGDIKTMERKERRRRRHSRSFGHSKSWQLSLVSLMIYDIFSSSFFIFIFYGFSSLSINFILFPYGKKLLKTIRTITIQNY